MLFPRNFLSKAEPPASVIYEIKTRLEILVYASRAPSFECYFLQQTSEETSVDFSGHPNR